MHVYVYVYVRMGMCAKAKAKAKHKPELQTTIAKRADNDVNIPFSGLMFNVQRLARVKKPNLGRKHGEDLVRVCWQKQTSKKLGRLLLDWPGDCGGAEG